MDIEIKILSILKNSIDLGKGSMQMQTIDLLLLKNGEREFVGIFLIEKINKMINEGLISKIKSQYSITAEGLDYLKNILK